MPTAEAPPIAALRFHVMPWQKKPWKQWEKYCVHFMVRCPYEAVDPALVTMGERECRHFGILMIRVVGMNCQSNFKWRCSVFVPKECSIMFYITKLHWTVPEARWGAHGQQRSFHGRPSSGSLTLLLVALGHLIGSTDPNKDRSFQKPWGIDFGFLTWGGFLVCRPELCAFFVLSWQLPMLVEVYAGDPSTLSASAATGRVQAGDLTRIWNGIVMWDLVLSEWQQVLEKNAGSLVVGAPRISKPFGRMCLSQPHWTLLDESVLGLR